ncbi:MAG: bifunctional phosphoribosylaminoimidazolecarboxamide formyltransferase/IMP cyclohydrolase [bacterium]
MPKIGRALLSVYDKTGIVELANGLQKFDVEILSTGGTAAHLQHHGIQTRSISEITQFPEILDGRVKTLHPKIFGGLLTVRENPEQVEEAQQHGIEFIDLVAVNLYPFEETVAKAGVTLLQAMENIDIGGPSMIRAAAKNYLSVAVVTSPDQYQAVLTELKKQQGQVSLELRKKLAAAAFARTQRYDAAISRYLSDGELQDRFPDHLALQLEKVQTLRYGENPHQKAAFYREPGADAGGLTRARQLHGKELSFNNLMDLDAALNIVQEFDEPCVVVLKHTNPCGVAVSGTLSEAYAHARATDPVSAFGGIVGLNRTLDLATAKAISEVFTEAVIAPGYLPEALELLKSKKNLRLIECAEASPSPSESLDIKRVLGGALLQERDLPSLKAPEFEVVTQRQPSETEWAAMKFGWRVVKWVKSNAVVFTDHSRTLGIGAGQMSRVDSSLFAVDKAGRMGLELKGSAVASDAFFPFRDGVDAAAQAGATAVIQPGGSIRDQEVIQAADEHNMTMVFTHVRHFRH